LEKLKCGFAVARRANVVLVRRQDMAHHANYLRFIINDKKFLFFIH